MVTLSCENLQRDIEQLRKGGFDKLPVCMAKTQQSLSDNPTLLGRPRDFTVNVREIQLAAGAGFIVPITGEILRMAKPHSFLAAERSIVEEAFPGDIIGLVGHDGFGIGDTLTTDP